MKIKNLEDLKRNINKSTILIFLTILFAALIGLFLIHSNFIHKKTILDQKEIIIAGNTFKTNLSEKLTIIASSSDFLDYLHSGKISRQRLSAQLISHIDSLKTKSIAGMELIDSERKVIFSYGEKKPDSITLKLCYFHQRLDPTIEDCHFYWQLYFQRNALLNEILATNSAIKICKNCNAYNFLSSNQFGNFPIKSNSEFKFKLEIISDRDYLFYLYLSLMTVTLMLSAYWNWSRLSTLLNTYLTTPLHNLTHSLKSPTTLPQKNLLEEIQFLANEINSWQAKLETLKTAEQSAKLGKIAAQLAHDIRSPLSAIDMLVKNLVDIPENYKVILFNAVHRISDIANNFLTQYKIPGSTIATDQLANEYIPSLLENIVSEKRSQYADRPIQLTLSIENNAWDIFSFINATEFKRVLSNLINNSIEAISKSGSVKIHLSKQDQQLKIDIIDNGCGIPLDMLAKIINEGISIGKKSGHGLGLSHAFNKIKEWHGDINAHSKTGIGTTISILLPLSHEIPAWFKSVLPAHKDTFFCIIDDNQHAHDLWKIRFTHFAFKQCHLTHVNEIEKFIHDHAASQITYLIDYDLGDQLTGLDMIKKYHLTNNAILVTHRYDDIELQQRCIALGVQIIPKNFILHIPLTYPQ